jgi:hypothetical protein
LKIGEVPPGSGFWWDFSMALGFTGMAMMGVQFLLTAGFRFEANLFFYSTEVAAELERDFISHCAEAREVTAVNRQGISKYQRLSEGVGRVLAPLL